MCKQHWERVMDLIRENNFPKNVNLLEVRAYMYACYLECKITIEEWDQFELEAYNLEPSLLRGLSQVVGASHSYSCPG